MMLLVTIVTGANAETISIKWLSGISETGTTAPSYAGVPSVTNIVTANNLTCSTPVSFAESRNRSLEGATSTIAAEFRSTNTTKQKVLTTDYIEFSISVPAGYRFTPTSIVASVGANGTNNNGAKLYEQDTYPTSDVSSTIKKGSEGGTQISCTPTEKTYNNETYTFRMYIGCNKAEKGVEIQDVILTGTYEVASTDPVPASITTQPSDIEANVGVEATLSVTAAGYPTPSYQWYSCDDADKTNAQPIEGATSASYSFTPEATGNLYFYVTVQNENNTQAVVSNVATVTVSAGQTEAPTFTVYGNTVQLESTTEGATIYYELDNPDVKTSENKIEYTGTFIPTASGTIYAYAEKTGFNASDVASKQVTLSTVGDVVGDLIATVQAAKGAETTTFGNVTVTSPESPSWDGRGVYPEHMKVSGTVTLTASNGATIQSIKIYGTSNDGSKVATITAGEGATVITTPAEIMPRDVTVGGEQVMSEVVITVDAPEANNSISFTLGRESRLYIEVYGAEAASTETIEIPEAGVATYVTTNAVDFSSVEGFTAYVPTGVNSAKTSVATAEVTTVPAGTAVLLKGTAGSYDVEIVASAEAPAANLFLVSDGNVQGADNIFAYHKTNKKFMKVASTVTIPAGKCYLQIDGVSGDALDLDFEGEATAIENVNANDNANSAAPVKVIKNGKLYIGNYNVAGQQVK